jgi:hypothetical protein
MPVGTGLKLRYRGKSKPDDVLGRNGTSHGRSPEKASDHDSTPAKRAGVPRQVKRSSIWRMRARDRVLSPGVSHLRGGGLWIQQMSLCRLERFWPSRRPAGKEDLTTASGHSTPTTASGWVPTTLPHGCSGHQGCHSDTVVHWGRSSRPRPGPDPARDVPGNPWSAVPHHALPTKNTGSPF